MGELTEMARMPPLLRAPRHREHDAVRDPGTHDPSTESSRDSARSGRFVLLSTQRSGTSWVMERLASHPEIQAYGELLLSPRAGWPDWPPGAGDRPFFDTYLADRHVSYSSIRRHRQLYRFLDWVYEPRLGCRTIGFKLMYDEARPYPEVWPYLRSRRVRVLHLLRENLLDIVVSQMGTTIRKRVHAWSPEEKEDIRIPVDTAALIPWLVRLERERKVARLLLRLSGLAACELTYESLLQSDAALDSALAFLGVRHSPAAGLHCEMLKLAPFSHRAGIANFDEVATRLAGTRFHRFLRP